MRVTSAADQARWLTDVPGRRRHGRRRRCKGRAGL